MITIAVANLKAGAGKTSTTYALGSALSQHYKRSVLMVDLDPQAILTESCGVHTPYRKSLADVIGGANPMYSSGRKLSLRDVITRISPGLDLAPGDMTLAVSEFGLNVRLGREWIVKNALMEVARDYNACLVDCPVSLGLLTINALAAADAVLIPNPPNLADIRGLKLFLDSIRHIQEEINPGLRVLGVLLTFYEARQPAHQRMVEALRTANLPVLPVMIARTNRFHEAFKAGKSIVSYAPEGPQARAYREVAEGIEKALRLEDERWR